MKRCFIIGNGPSQNNVDLTLLKDETTFGMNDIRLKFDTFMPSYWVITDNHYWQRYKAEITDWDSHTCRVCFLGKTDSHPRDRMEKVDVYGDMRTLLDGRISFYGEGGAPYYFSVGNVGYICMQMAWAKGFRELNLIGFDAQEPRPKLKEHFDPNYGERLRDPTERSKGFGLPSNLWLDAYAYAVDWIHGLDGEIWNVSDGAVDVFPKRSFEESLK